MTANILSDIFSRTLTESKIDPRILLDKEIDESNYSDNFGLEWTKFDGYSGKESLSHGHLFGRFVLPSNFFANKFIVDVGCGNGRLGRFMYPTAKTYLGIDMSESVYSFPKYSNSENVILCRSSGTNLPIKNGISDITVCWGVLHHMHDPEKGLNELIRTTKIGGEIIIFIYPTNFDFRKNLNTFAKNIDSEVLHKILNQTSDLIDSLSEVDNYLGSSLANGMALSIKRSREWQLFQWFDGISPKYHWSLEKFLDSLLSEKIKLLAKTAPGCYRFIKIND